MSDYAAVAPSQTNISANYDTNPAFADALQRARQIAAKINTPSADSNSIGGGTKRPHEDSMDHFADGTPEPKKIAAVNDPFGAQLAAMQQQQRAALGNPTAVMVEEWSVPDKMVGLIIGRGGEQISRLQAESGCKIQMAPDSGGAPDRSCTLTGSKQSIEKAKELIGQIVNRGGSSIPPIDPNHIPEGHTVVEMMIPGGKVGLVIGKGGETIRNLQERAGVKMVMIQDGPRQTSHEKPLRITGEPQKCEYAKQLIMDLITEKELENLQRGGFMQQQTNEYGTSHGGGGPSTQEVMVPRQAVGVVIGKGGDMIKRIQQDSGAKVQFQQGKDDGPGDRICLLSGNPEEVQKAANIINDLIRSVIAGDQQSMGRGRGRGRGFDGSNMGPPNFSGPGMGRGRPGDMNEVQFSVPANKCGLVIGKGGETIRSINQQTGAHVELSRAPPPNPQEKVFLIRGSPQQIEHAQQLINERVGGAPGPQGPPGPYPNQFPQPYQQQPPPPQPYAPQGWSNAYPQWQNQNASPNDPANKATANDPNAAAWAAYYAQYYGQQPQQQTPAPSNATTQQQPAQQQPTPGAATPATGSGQPDYSAAWAEYYRSYGMFREAEMIEQQARASQAQAAQQQPGQQYSQQPQQPYSQQPPSAPGTTSAPAPPNSSQPGGAPAPQGQPQTAPSTSQPGQPQTGTPAPAPPQGQQYQQPGAPPGQWPPAGYPQQQQPQPQQQQQQQQQNPYGQQQNPYAGYNYAAYGAQQYPGAAQ